MTRVRAEDLETDAVSRRAIRAGAVGRDELDERLRPGGGWWQGAVGKGMIAPGGVIAGNIAPGAVQAPDLDDNSVTAPKIAPGSVTGPALADGSVSGPKVPAGALGARELADGSLTALKFAQGTRPVQIVDGLPADPLDAGFLPGDAVVNVVDDDVKIHRLTLTPSGWDRWSAANDTWDAAASWPTGVWTSAVDTGDLKGLLAEGNFGDDLIVARMVAADQIGATELAAIRMEVGKWIRSFNWDPGVAGWAIDGDGNAEFNDVTVRGGLLVGGTVQTSALVSNDYVAGSAGWALDPAGNTELNDLTIRGAVAVGSGIVSSNYTAGTSGWAIDALGTVEFNDATFRGNIEASSVTSGQLVSANYTAGVDGWAIDAAGTAEFNDVTVRGVLDTRKGGNGGIEVINDEIRFYRSSDGFQSGSIAFPNNADIVYDAAGDHEFTVGGVTRFTVADNVVSTDGVPLSAPVYESQNFGSAGSPTYTWDLDRDTGMYRSTTNAIGFAANGTERVVIGASGFIAHGVYEVTTAGAANVNVDSGGRLERSTSSARYKRDIAGWSPDGQVLTLTPSTFLGSHGDTDGRVFDGHRSLGLIAEDVAARFPWAVIRDGQGRPDAIDWNAITAALLGELARTNARVEALEAA